MATLSGSANPANYWYVLKNRLKKAGGEILTRCKGFKLLAPDGKRRASDCLDSTGIVELAKQLLKRSFRKCIDWSKVDKKAYLDAMRRSVADSHPLKELLKPALTAKIADREMFMKGIDYSYYYEEGE